MQAQGRAPGSSGGARRRRTSHNLYWDIAARQDQDSDEDADEVDGPVERVKGMDLQATDDQG